MDRLPRGGAYFNNTETCVDRYHGDRNVQTFKCSDYLFRQSSVRLQGGDLILRGFDNEEIMDFLEVSLSSVKRWRKKVETEGLYALARKASTHSNAKLTPEQFEELKTVLTQGATASGYLTDRWTSLIVADLILKKWNVKW